MSDGEIGEFAAQVASGDLTRARTSVARAWREWRVPLGLVVLSIVPVAAGAFRLRHLASSGGATLEPERFVTAPVPVAVHIVAATVFSLLGALQFAPSLRRRSARWHRIAGRVVLPAGLVTALSGLWMTLTFRLPLSDTVLLSVFRISAGIGMFVSLVLSFTCIRKRNIEAHRAWSLRGYALGMGAGTQVLTHLPWLLLRRDPRPDTRALLMGAAWLLNILIAEWCIRGASSTGRSR